MTDPNRPACEADDYDDEGNPIFHPRPTRMEVELDALGVALPRARVDPSESINDSINDSESINDSKNTDPDNN